MKYTIIILLVAGIVNAEPSRKEFEDALREYNTPIKQEDTLPKCPEPIVVRQASMLPDWAWFALGGLSGIAGVSFFYYNRQAK